MPSLAQLHDAVMAFIDEHPDALITVVVDATFGHRIDSREVAEFDDAVANNELVAPPAGAIGRGDAFLLSIANKVGATVLSNDSFQEFHGVYTWLFDEGRLIGGKPVPHIGWVFVPRVPVRGPISRTAVKDARRKKDGQPARAPKRQVSAEASLPMPVPKTPPPNAVIRATSPARSAQAPARAPSRVSAAAPVAAAPAAAAHAPKVVAVNDLMPFLSFVEHHPVGTSVNAIVESYSSHGAYVRLAGDVVGYVPLRLMADPAPRSAREFLTIGDAVTLVVESFAPARRSIDLATVPMASAAPPPKTSARRAGTRPSTPAAAALTATEAEVKAVKPAAKAVKPSAKGVKPAATAVKPPAKAAKPVAKPEKPVAKSEKPAAKSEKPAAKVGKAGARPDAKAAKAAKIGAEPAVVHLLAADKKSRKKTALVDTAANAPGPLSPPVAIPAKKRPAKKAAPALPAPLPAPAASTKRPATAASVTAAVASAAAVGAASRPRGGRSGR
jgi:hypothetical protein